MIKPFVQKVIFLSLFIFLFVPLFSLANGLVQFSVMGNSLCPYCSIEVQKFFESYYLRRPEIQDILNPGKKQQLIFVSDYTFFDPSSIFRQPAQWLGLTEIGRSLIQTYNQSGQVEIKVYYTYGLTSGGLTPLGASSIDTPLWEKRGQDSHEYYGFLTQYKVSGTSFTVILLNDFQTPAEAAYTLVHELFHLFDMKTRNYIAQVGLDQWTALDTLAMDIRAHIGEINYHQQVSQAQSNDLLRTRPFYNEYLESGGRINYSQLISDRLHSLTKGPEDGTLVMDSQTPPQLLTFNRSQSFNLQRKDIFSGPLRDTNYFEGLFWLAQRITDNRNQYEGSPLHQFDHLALFTYSNSAVEAQKVRGKTDEFKAEIEVTLKKRGFENLESYLRAKGLIEENESFQFSPTPLETLWLKGDPKFRDGGDHENPVTQGTKRGTKIKRFRSTED